MSRKRGEIVAYSVAGGAGLITAKDGRYEFYLRNVKDPALQEALNRGEGVGFVADFRSRQNETVARSVRLAKLSWSDGVNKKDWSGASSSRGRKVGKETAFPTGKEQDTQTPLLRGKPVLPKKKARVVRTPESRNDRISQAKSPKDVRTPGTKEDTAAKELQFEDGDPIGRYFLGVVLSEPRGSTAGALRGISELALENEEFRVKDSDGHKDLGPKALVWFTGDSDKLRARGIHQGATVRFRVWTRTVFYGLLEEDTAWYEIDLGDENDEIEPIGALILSRTFDWVESSREVSTSIKADQVYCFLDHSIVRGPWAITQRAEDAFLYPASKPGYVVEFQAEDIEPSKIFTVDGQDYLLPIPVSRVQRWLAVEPTDGDHISLAKALSGRELMTFLKVAKRLGYEQTDLEPDLGALVDECFEKRRYGEVISAIERYKLKTELSIDQLLMAMHSLKDYSGFLKHALQQDLSEDLEGPIRHSISQLETKGQVPQAQAYRKQFQELAGISSSPPVAKTDSEAKHTPAEARLSDELDFVLNAVAPRLRNWFPEVTEREVLSFHAAIISSPLTLVPDLIWARAYRSALAGKCESFYIPVSPLWVSFTDAFVELSIPWSFAEKNPQKLVIACLDLINRSMLDYWIRPILQVADDQLEKLPGGAIWPPNLRVVATLDFGPLAQSCELQLSNFFATPDLTERISSIERKPKVEGAGFEVAPAWLDEILDRSPVGSREYRRENLSEVIFRVVNDPDEAERTFEVALADLPLELVQSSRGRRSSH